MTDPSLSDVMHALDDIAAAVRRMDREDYVQAVEKAHAIGCTDEQVHDAYTYPVSKMKTGPGFDIEGNMNV